MDFETLKGTTLTYLKKGKEIAVDATERGRVEVLVLNNKARLYRAQRQLGALVYSLAKGHEENQPLVDKYVSVIAAIEAETERLKASLTPEEKKTVEEAEQAAAAAEYVVVEDAPPAAQEAPAAAEEVEVVEVEVLAKDPAATQGE